MFDSHALLTLIDRLPAATARRPHNDEPKPGGTGLSPADISSSSYFSSGLSSSILVAGEVYPEPLPDEDDEAVDNDVRDPLRSPFSLDNLSETFERGAAGSGGSGGTSSSRSLTRAEVGPLNERWCRSVAGGADELESVRTRV